MLLVFYQHPITLYYLIILNYILFQMKYYDHSSFKIYLEKTGFAFN